MDTTSHWQKTAALPKFPQISHDHEVDVVIVGAGLTGLTAAYLFQKAGYTVAVLERGRCGGFDTANTTAHLTHVTDTPLHKLTQEFGSEAAWLVWEGGRAAIEQIYNISRTEGIACDFKWVPGYYHAGAGKVDEKERKRLQEEASLANEMGFTAEYMDSVPLMDRPGVKFLQQAKFHPLKYLAGLLRIIPGRGSHIFENSAVTEVLKRPMAVKTDEHRIRCSYVFLATHTPLMGKTGVVSAAMFQTKLFLYTSYALGARIPTGAAPEASFWDTNDPYDYLRIDRHGKFDYAIFGGGDHKTGQQDNTAAVYRQLEKKLARLFPKAKVDAHWSGQVIETPDGLPYMGETAPRQYVATGFSGNGMTFGTLGAMMAVDAFVKRKNPWASLFDVNRKSVAVGTWDYLKENKDYPYYYLRDRMAAAQGKSLRSLGRHQGKILELDGEKVAAYCDEHGKVTLSSPVCTHLGCIVGWNDAEKTWDCPCHGSRFAPTGEVLTGPAEEPLEKAGPPKE
ncbi:MAG TPA: FAD-dependent oxidoreductase [Candidatus Saccharimonadales bacterium]|nr:FAD-dependent oxidoreductase [Candidatus Saccharimonadales bacterium]